MAGIVRQRRLDRGAPGRRGAQGAAGRGRHGRSDGRGRTRRVRHGHHAPSDRFPCAQALQFGRPGAALRRTGYPRRHCALCVPHQPGQRPRGDELAAGRDAGRGGLARAPTRAGGRKGRVRRGGRAARADGYGGVHAPHAARAGRSGRAPQRHRFARGAARGGLHRCGGFDDRRRAPCRG